ncbi:Cilia- and flagella-associated protein 221 [Liparis tanakae]|uniref:Cilia-and flagella-associated protein 221 n=1 Tax=Liparis tanakae TaxID=230148 RepID=A0A4Z2GRZ4_9TELE|nr:Cilia- and flagella-associated protein 221 [Liparis tanakae]
MEVAPPALQTPMEPLRRSTPRPLSQLVEESRSPANFPNHLLESKIYAKLKSHSLIHAEPPELHFSGFELRKDYIKYLKLINISSEVVNIHIIPTQTEHFQTTYTKKYRLIPGLAYTLKVRLCPDEWRYFYDCIRVHCKGEENLLIPVHAYPVIDDLHIPPRIDLSVVPLGQSVHHAIPLRCSCPVDFEFQVYVIQPHEAFSIHPLTVQHAAVPLHHHRELRPSPSAQTLTDPAVVQAAPTPPVDVCSPAGVAKMLIRDPDKLRSKDLREAISGGGTVVLQNRQVKEALFMKEVQANQLRWGVHLGKDPVSERPRRQVAEEREIALHEFMVRSGGGRPEEDFAPEKPKLSSGRVLCDAGQACEGAPSFQPYRSFQWELRRRALGLFQQAARKVMIRCRVNRRRSCLRKPPDSRWNSPAAKKEEETTCDLKISQDKIFPFAFPVFSREDDPVAPGVSLPLPADPFDVTVTTRVPFFELQVPQHYKLMGYRPVSAWDAFTSYVPATLARPLRTGAPDDLVPDEVGARSPAPVESPQRDDEEGEAAAARLSFSAPEALLGPFPANPLRIFVRPPLTGIDSKCVSDPDPGLQTYKPTPKYLESDPEFHLCPLSRYTIPEGIMCGRKTRSAHTPRFMDHKRPSSQPASPGDWAPRRCEGAGGVQLTPEMIRAEFLSAEALASNRNLTSTTTVRRQRELQVEAACRSECNQLGKRVTARLKRFGGTDGASPGEDCE